MWYKINRIMMRPNGVEKQVRPPKPKTYTIVWSEASFPSQFFVRYEDDAAWLTQWDAAFDTIFWYYGCRLNTSWQETATITQEDSGWAWKLDITQLWTLTSGDNVMIAFPVRWIKMTKSWTTVTLSITEWLGRESEWYQYYAHCNWTLSNPWTPKDVFYLWAYKTVNNGSNVLKSRSGKYPEGSQTEATFCSRASANGSWYNIIWYYQRMYIDALYMMKYGNPYSQNVVWLWNTVWSTQAYTWWTNSQTNATYWTTVYDQVKLFWLEDWWGNAYEWIWWAYSNSSKNLCVQLSWYSWTTSWWEDTWSTITVSSWNYNITRVAWNNQGMFCPTGTNSNSRYNTYYCGHTNVGTSCLICWSGSTNNGAGASAFHFAADLGSSASGAQISSRLLYL